ncbi:helix-turn-helix domain-containing protein [Shewanella sp. D64]|uniref:helix-turn-helix domain-containing protein n=1 Tax=unclassified Shewanella TaxID=196818 RepID=UPI0022BA168A|nr:MULTISPECIES: helix-turn-helix transcriptional regulator [unclassified Shewanella]MEC4727242.1 helix-turn-helix domain-containing protein [Shewanella sp. D64]MEC4739397.1 helix-turn-helix domain-containing protein [Shewanella sp. E94]WBJ96726.1 helix-turn-helix domain-containing protein [Shewanella sp. MTB7]
MDWHNADIKAALEKKGLSLAGLARMYKISPTGLRTTLVRRYRRGEKIIAKHVGVPPEVIWPSRYPQVEVSL